MAEGCALVAFPKWKRTGVRVSNHSFDFDDQHVEWLSIVRPDGAVRFLQHFPEFKPIKTKSGTLIVILKSVGLEQLKSIDRNDTV